MRIVRKMLSCLLLFALLPWAQAVTTSDNFKYDDIKGNAQNYYGEVYTIVGTLLYIEEYHRSSDTSVVEEYARIAVDGDDKQTICLHYVRDKNLFPLKSGIPVAVLAYVDGVQRVGKDIVPLMESDSRPMPLNGE